MLEVCFFSWPLCFVRNGVCCNLCVEVKAIIDGKKGEGGSVCDVAMRMHIKLSGLQLTGGFVLFLKVGKSYLDSFGCKLGLINRL